MLWALLVLAGFYLAVGKIWLPRFARRIFQQQRDLQSEVVISWDDQAFRTVAASGQAFCAWGDFHAWRRNEKSLLLYRSEALFNFLPLTDASSQAAAESMVLHLRNAGVKERP